MSTNINLREWDVIVINTSGGKDSQAMLSEITDKAAEEGVLDRCVAVHADLGRVEWEGTKELAEFQARIAGIAFHVTSRIKQIAKVSGKVYRKGEAFGDLLDYVERRGAWPSNTARYCTSEFKRGPVRRVWTKLVSEWREQTGETRPCRVLNCMGLRAQESSARAKKTETLDVESTSKRHVMDWLPILDWTEEDVWAKIRESGLPHHEAYDHGMPRLSCVFCVFAPKSALVLAGTHNRELLDEYAAVEARINHTFRTDVSMADVKAAVDAGETGCCNNEDKGCWNM